MHGNQGKKNPKNAEHAKRRRFWEASPSSGRKLKYTPEEFRKGCFEYFQWVEDNPLEDNRVFAFKGEYETVPVEKMRAMTITGLCIFMGISPKTWDSYKEDENRDEYHEICDEVAAIIYTQKFTGASADLLNANIITRDLGLADKKEHLVEDSLKKLTDAELDQKIRELNKMKELSE